MPLPLIQSLRARALSRIGGPASGLVYVPFRPYRGESAILEQLLYGRDAERMGVDRRVKESYLVGGV